MQRTSKQWELIWFFTIPVNLVQGCDTICLLTKPASLQNILVQKCTKLKEWTWVSDAKFTLHHFCCSLLRFAQQQPWVWKDWIDKSFKTLLCHMSKLFLFLVKAPACLKAYPPPKSFPGCYSLVGMCCLTVTHFGLSVSSPTCTVLKLFWHSPEAPHTWFTFDKILHLFPRSAKQNRERRLLHFCNQMA